MSIISVIVAFLTAWLASGAVMAGDDVLELTDGGKSEFD